MPKAYLFAEIEITDAAEFERYRDAVPPTIAAYGGRYAVRGGDAQMVEGEPGVTLRTVLLEFPSRERLMAWYNSAEYEGPKAMRVRSTNSRVWVMTGLDD